MRTIEQIVWRVLGTCLLGALPALGPQVRAGEPIQFSTPPRKVALPSPTQPELKTPGLGFKLDFGGQEAPMPPIQAPVHDPIRERMLREKEETPENWLFSEPALFRDPFESPQKPQTAFEAAFKGWDRRTDRVLGRSREPKEASANSTPGYTPLFSDQPLVGNGSGSLGLGATLGLMSSGDSKNPLTKDSAGDKSDSSLKALFEQRNPDQKMPVLPGMSLYDMLGAARGESKTDKKERETRREEFDRLLSPTATVTPPETGPLGRGLMDETRSPLNPVLPLPVSALEPPPRNRLDPILPANPLDRLNQPRLPLDDTLTRHQSPAAARPEPNRAGQMESLRLMSRPSILSFPSRQF